MPTESPEQLKKIAANWEDNFNGHAVELKKKRLKDLIESPELMDAQIAYKEETEQYSTDNEKWWNELPEEEREKAFYAVCKRIYKSDIEKQGSYRYALYQIFGFDMSMYGVGMDCGYIDIHNTIYGGVELAKMTDAKKIIIKNKKDIQTIELDSYQKIFVKLKDDDNILEIDIKNLPKTYDHTP
jgi:hypothetical protein|tara:strand:- start:10685 stop:11236 length:552 start_codon:yes stop_codon:yes gene_type:complete